MVTKIVRWGNSLGLRIPKSIAEETNVCEGTFVDVSVKDGQLVIKPVRSKKYSLRELLTDIRPENLHGEISTGDPVGREVF